MGIFTSTKKDFVSVLRGHFPVRIKKEIVTGVERAPCANVVHVMVVAL